MSRRVSRSVVNFWVDFSLLLLFLSLCGTAVINQYIFPPGPLATGWTLWTLDYDGWRWLQFGLTAAMALGVLVHVMLHWPWVCGVVRVQLLNRRAANRQQEEAATTIYGVATLIVILNLLGGIIAVAALSVRSPEESTAARRRAAVVATKDSGVQATRGDVDQLPHD